MKLLNKIAHAIFPFKLTLGDLALAAVNMMAIRLRVWRWLIGSTGFRLSVVIRLYGLVSFWVK